MLFGLWCLPGLRQPPLRMDSAWTWHWGMAGCVEGGWGVPRGDFPTPVKVGRDSSVPGKPSGSPHPADPVYPIDSEKQKVPRFSFYAGPHLCPCLSLCLENCYLPWRERRCSPEATAPSLQPCCLDSRSGCGHSWHFNLRRASCLTPLVLSVPICEMRMKA